MKMRRMFLLLAIVPARQPCDHWQGRSSAPCRLQGEGTGWGPDGGGVEDCLRSTRSQHAFKNWAVDGDAHRALSGLAAIG
jgi:hypothetical protein